MQQVEPLALQVRGQVCHSSEVSAWPVEGTNQTVSNRIAGIKKHDRNGRGGGLGRDNRGECATGSDDNRHMTADQIVSKHSHPPRIRGSPAVFNRYIFSLSIPSFGQTGP